MSLRPLDQRGGTSAPGLGPTAAPTSGLGPIKAGLAPRRRGILGGLVVFAVGTAFLFPALGMSGSLSGPLLFVAIGAAFAASYWYGNRQYAYLVPAATLLGLGVGLLIPAVFDLGALSGPTFFAALALSLISVTLLAPDRKWPLIPAAPLALIAVTGAVGRIDLVPAGMQQFILPVLLMLVGAYILFEPTHR
ncbi:MAG: hypothetical protein A3G84_08320 [Chloroflexi bacterium RIFCSPLOWO2_12_FULL_71_12]|nr:MAG: hypothetical protein A3G84_08320 [Chloroflexi bacterium RIFCSPLOWO2_12_FULL_71_12]